MYTLFGIPLSHIHTLPIVSPPYPDEGSYQWVVTPYPNEGPPLKHFLETPPTITMQIPTLGGGEETNMDIKAAPPPKPPFPSTIREFLLPFAPPTLPSHVTLTAHQ